MLNEATHTHKIHGVTDLFGAILAGVESVNASVCHVNVCVVVFASAR